MAPNKADLRVMVDANILIAGSLWTHRSYVVLPHALAGDFQLVLSPCAITRARRLWVSIQSSNRPEMRFRYFATV
jgi:hypothetical protein